MTSQKSQEGILAESPGAGFRGVLVGLACVTIVVVASALFMPQQSIWVDEVTQLSGMSLNVVDVTMWLANQQDHDFGVPDDRMPPLSYWAGIAWSKVVGLGETQMRWFGVCWVALATALVFTAGWRAWGLGSGTAAALLLGLSPNVVWMSVEIRAYPMFIGISAALFSCLVAYAIGDSGGRRGWLIGLVVCGVAAMYTHFFGLVAFGGGLVGAFLVSRMRGEKVWPVVLAGVVGGVAALGLYPFVTASMGISGGVERGLMAKGIGLVRLCYRLFSHPTIFVNPIMVALAGVGFLVAVLGAMTRKRRSGLASLGLLAALGSGGTVVAIARFAQSSFDAVSPSYNLWILPALALFLSSGLAAEARWTRRAAFLGIGLLLAGNVYGTVQLMVRGTYFAHTMHGQLADEIRRHGDAGVALVHDADAVQSYMIYTAIHYEFSGNIPQYRHVSETPEGGATLVETYPMERKRVDPIGLPYETLIVIRSRQNNTKDLTSQIRGTAVPLGDGPVARALLDSGLWERVKEETYVMFLGADIDVFRRREPLLRSSDSPDQSPGEKPGRVADQARDDSSS